MGLRVRQGGGQDAFICFKNGAGVADGHVYLRADGETRQAKSDELVQLRLRAKPAMPSIELRVTADEPATHIVCDPATPRDQFVVAVRNARDQARRDAEPASTPGRFAPSAPLLGPRPEPRSPETYAREIETWAATFRRQWPDYLDAVAAVFLRGATFTVQNPSTHYLEDAELRIHLAGDVRGVDFLPPDTQTDNLTPSPPRPWGPLPAAQVAAMAGLLRPSQLQQAAQAAASSFPQSRSVTYDNGGSVDIVIPVGDLRPGGTFISDDDEIVLLLDHPQEAVEGTWELTARGIHAVFSGTLEVPTVTRNFTPGVRTLLNLGS